MSLCPCEPGGSFLRAAAADIDRYVFLIDRGGPRRPFSRVKAFVLYPGLRSVVLYRLSHWITMRWGPLRNVGWLVCLFCEAAIGASVEPYTHAGEGLLINHVGGTYLAPRRIGANCNFGHGVTIGRSTTEDLDGDIELPTVGDRVWVGPGAVVTGSVHLGDDCVVSANSLVVKDVTPRGLAVGVPARVLPGKGSFSQVAYRWMERDPARISALAANEPDAQTSAGPAVATPAVATPARIAAG